MADCIKELKAANKERIEEDELIEILEALQLEKKRRVASKQLEGIENAMFKRGELLAAEADMARMQEKRNRYRSILIENRIMEMVYRADKETGDPSLGLEAVFVGVNRDFEGAKNSVDSLNEALMIDFMSGLTADLKRANVEVQFNNMTGDLARETSRVLANLNLKDPKPISELKVSSDAVKLGEIMFKYQRAAYQRENQAGAFIRLKEGRVVGASHDPAKMVKVGRDEWVAFIDKELNWNKTAGGEFALPKELEADKVFIEQLTVKRREFLERSYDAIITGKRGSRERTEIEKSFKGPGNLAKRESASALFTFRNSDAWYDYDQKFGRASLRESFFQDIQTSLRSTAIMDKLSTNPEAMYKRILDRAEQEFKGDPKKLARLRRGARTWHAMYEEVTGNVNLGSHTTLAQVGYITRSLQTMAKLGGTVIAALADIAFVSANRNYQGRSILDSWGDALQAPFKGMGRGPMREFADRLGVGFEGQLGDFYARFSVNEDVPGRMAKLMNLYFKLNLLQPWTESSKRGVTLMISNDLGREAAKSFDEVGEDLQRILRVYGIDSAKWDKARTSVETGPDGRVYLMPGNIEDLSLRENFFQLLVTEADNSVITPGARERAILRQGYRPDEPAGQAIRFFTQFKAFGVTAISKPLGRQIYGKGAYGIGAAGMKDQLKKGMGANMGLVNLMVGTTVMGYFVMQLKEMAKGREPRENNMATFFAAMLQGGGMGIYGDFLFSETSRYGGGALQTLAGPLVTDVSEAIDLYNRARNSLTGGDDDVSGDLLRLVKRNTPFGNIFYTKPVLDYLLWYQLQESINPGYLRRSEQRWQRENEREFIIRPSEIVSTGGGFR